MIHKDLEHIKFTFDLAHLKDPSFISEKEWRGISFSTSEKIEYFVRNSIIVPYFDYKYNKASIKEIIIGPAKFQEKNRQAVSMIVQQYGLNCKVSKSTIPFIQY